MPKAPAIDVIVPVHNAYDKLAACLASVQKRGGYDRLILIDDCSSDERNAVLFRRLSAKRSSQLTLLRNERNLGFVATVNRGMSFSRNDVVLLNSDTLVTHGWLDKIRRCAASDPGIGTITPFSNNAEICSFPRFCQNNPAPDDPELVNRAMETAAVPSYPDIPTGVGFCMFIRRRLIEEIGAFDEAFAKDVGPNSIGRGAYEVENDFSMRAREAGYRNVLCDDTFVVHRGLRSFGDPVASSAETNLAKVLAKHPSYMELVREFIKNDPVKPIRSMIQSQLTVLSRQGNPGVLHVLHDRGGGTEKYVRELISASHDDYRHYFLRILPDRWRVTDIYGATPTSYDYRWRLTDAGDAARTNYDYPREVAGSQFDWLTPLCSWLRIGLIHVHSLVGSGDDLLQILEKTSLPYCYSVHDMYLPCPTVHLIDSHGEYCDATTDNTVCRRCLSKFVGMEDVDIAQWRRRYRAFLDKASMIFAPSQWARDTLQKYYPGIRITVAPPEPKVHDNKPTYAVSQGFHLPTDECRHIGVLGAIGPEKGARHLETLVARIRDRSLPLRLVVVGYTDRESRYQSRDDVLTIHGPYKAEEIGLLLDHYRVGLVVFPTVWPETFGYTLSETWMAGRPALVPPRGALEERVLATGAGWIMRGWPDADSILDQLMELTSAEHRGELERKAQLAKTAFRNNHGGTDLITKSYNDMLTETPTRNEHSVSRVQIHDAASRALGMGPLAQDRGRPSAKQTTERIEKRRFFRLFRS